MAHPLRGERFHIPLPDDFDDDLDSSPRSAPHPAASPETDSQPAPLSFDTLVKDISERPAGNIHPPRAPIARGSAGTGFPSHAKRASRFKSARQQASEGATEERVAGETQPVRVPARDSKDGDSEETLRREIDAENRLRIAAMSDDEIEQERAELLRALSPGLVGRLVGRGGGEVVDTGNIEKEDDDTRLERTRGDEDRVGDSEGKAKRSSGKRVTFDKTPATAVREPNNATGDFDETTRYNNDTSTGTEPVGSMHFPQPAQPPSLDPSSPNFLTDLHSKYFPSLPHDPAKLAWMQETTSPTSEAATATPTNNVTETIETIDIDPSTIRFDLRGRLLHPSYTKSEQEIPSQSTASQSDPHTHDDPHGHLDDQTESHSHNHQDHHNHHHHATHTHDPNTTGHTLADLARLARSSVPSQRCVAFQTLGRVLYRLGRGEFGPLPAPSSHDRQTASSGARVFKTDTLVGASRVDTEDNGLAMGIWKELEKGRVVETLEAESGREGPGHVSARAYAVEALWLWGNGREEASARSRRLKSSRVK